MFADFSATTLWAHHFTFRPRLRGFPHISRLTLPERFGSTAVAPFTHSDPSCPGEDQDVVNFVQRFGKSNTIRGLPPFDAKRVVHASQTIEVLKPLPLVSGPGWRIKKRLAAVRENSGSLLSPWFTATLTVRSESGVIIESEFTLVDPNDTPYTRLFVRHPHAMFYVVRGANVTFILTCTSPRPSIWEPSSQARASPVWPSHRRATSRSQRAANPTGLCGIRRRQSKRSSIVSRATTTPSTSVRNPLSLPWTLIN